MFTKKLVIMKECKSNVATGKSGGRKDVLSQEMTMWIFERARLTEASSLLLKSEWQRVERRTQV